MVLVLAAQTRESTRVLSIGLFLNVVSYNDAPDVMQQDK